MTDLLDVKEGKVENVSNTKDWYAWINLVPPPPNDFHAIGEVLVANLGVKAFLTPKEPQGINSTILLLDLLLVQQPGFWPQVPTWVEARYDKIVFNNPYKLVQIYSGETQIVELPVEEVH